MKNKIYTPLLIVLVAALACSVPGSTPAQPTVNALPPTPDLPFSASPVPQDSTSGNQPETTFSNVVREEFDGKLSPGLGWTWLRQDNANWSLSATPGWLRINVSTASYLNGLPVNVLTAPAPQGDFDLRTSMNFSPTQNFEFAGLVILFDEKSLVQAGRAFCDLGSCPGSGFYFDNLQNASTVGENFGVANSTGQSQVRILRQGNIYTAYYQVDGATWVEIGAHSVDSQPISVGLIAAQAQSAGSYAEFDWFEIAQP
jgi:regulation of enolase protein 1 (concanavalin A-like superfamily)